MAITLNPQASDIRRHANYDRLTFGERLFLDTCCYNPPRPHRARTLEGVQQTEHFAAEYERAFGPRVWEMIAGQEVLDLGCGEGGHALALAAHGAAHVTGLDTLPTFHNAEKEAARRGYPVTFIGADAATLPDASFDVVFSHDSFEHFADPAQVLAEMTRLARPGGRLLIKFGPPWRNPWGRHMGGTIRRDRPWVHLIVSERTIMHVQSVYHDEPVMKERYAELPGGLNRMTVGRFRRLLQSQSGLRIEEFTIKPLYWAGALAAVPVVGEFFASSVRAIGIRE
jgi:SAM-dependent methyltransferase